MARHVTILMKLTASFDMFKKGWGGPGRGLTTSLQLKCYISWPTWPDILWIFRPDIMCSCQYCLARYRPTSVHIMCIDYPSIVVLYKSEDTSMINVDFMLGQRDRSTLAQYFLNVGPMSQTMDQR